jgi:hypothetical protein
MEEYKDKCDSCNKKGSSTFARVFYTLIYGEWKHLCSRCWDSETCKRAKIQ